MVERDATYDAVYHRGGRVRRSQDQRPETFRRLADHFLLTFPQLSGIRFTHAWGGPLGIARDWWASVGLDRTTGIGWAGGYVGDGVGTSNLAGRTLADERQACGAAPINGLLRSFEASPLDPVLLQLRSSGDTAGDKARVVGYAAIAFQEPADA